MGYINNLYFHQHPSSIPAEDPRTWYPRESGSSRFAHLRCWQDPDPIGSGLSGLKILKYGTVQQQGLGFQPDRG